MKKTSLAIITLAALVAAIALVRAQDMGKLSGMGNMQETNALMVNTNGMSGSMNCYAATGIVESITSDRTKATIHHQAIPGYMMEMTMDFSVKDTNQLKGISPGDQITFQLIQATNEEWIENVNRTGKSAPAMTNSMPPMGGM